MIPDHVTDIAQLTSFLISSVYVEGYVHFIGVFQIHNVYMYAYSVPFFHALYCAELRMESCLWE